MNTRDFDNMLAVARRREEIGDHLSNEEREVIVNGFRELYPIGYPLSGELHQDFSDIIF